MSAATIFIDNVWHAAQSGASLALASPDDGQVLRQLARGDERDTNRAVRAARKAYETHWRGTTALERGRMLARWSQLVQARHDELAAMEARDTGKPLRQAKNDLTLAARYLEYYAGAADKLLGETIPFQAGHTVFTLREPHGVTGHILPWNYPAQMTARTLAPALAAGNAVVLKPAEQACLVALALVDLSIEAGFPPGVINVVTGTGEEAGAALVAHPSVDFISFTGSPEVGAAVQRACAEYNRPCVMELGGKSPQLVFADADLDAAIPAIVNAIVQNCGQTCSAGSRVLIEESAFEAVMERLVQAFEALRVGTSSMDLEVGPLISAAQKERLAGYVAQAQHDGIPCVAKGQLAPGLPAQGYFVAPRLYGPVPEDHPLAQEEIFGPVLAALPFRDEAEAVRIANGTPFGLVAGVWTRDGARQLRLARALRAGQVFVNTYGAGGGVELPFGGVGRSGFGREKGMAALHELTVEKTVVVKHG